MGIPKKALHRIGLAAAALAAGVSTLYPMASAAAACAKVYAYLRGDDQAPHMASAGVLGSNTLTALIPTIFAGWQTISRELVGFIPNVNRDPQIARAAKGQTVTSPIVPAATAADITPGVTAPNDGDNVFGSASITLTKARYVPIKWNGEEQLAINNGAGQSVFPLLRDQFTQAFRTLVNEMEGDLFLAAYKGASRAYGTPGTTPFGTAGDLSDFAETAKILDINGASPMRTMVVGANSMANLRGKQSVLFKVNESGTDDLLRNGRVGRVEGFDLGYSAGVKAVVKGTGTSYLSNGAQAVGATSIPIDTGTGTVLAGDVITWAGDTNKYVVTTGVAGAGTITIGLPGLQVALADNVAMTVGNSYTPNVAYSNDALVLATRLPAMPIDASGRAGDMADDRTVFIDPFSGIAFEIALYRQYRQIKYEVGLVWGTGIANGDHIAILQG